MFYPFLVIFTTKEVFGIFNIKTFNVFNFNKVDKIDFSYYIKKFKNRIENKRFCNVNSLLILVFI